MLHGGASTKSLAPKGRIVGGEGEGSVTSPTANMLDVRDWGAASVSSSGAEDNVRTGVEAYGEQGLLSICSNRLSRGVRAGPPGMKKSLRELGNLLR